MKESTFFVIVGILAAVSLTSGVLGWRYAKRKEETEKHGKPDTFNDLLEDNAPSDDYPFDGNDRSEYTY